MLGTWRFGQQRWLQPSNLRFLTGGTPFANHHPLSWVSRTERSLCCRKVFDSPTRCEEASKHPLAYRLVPPALRTLSCSPKQCLSTVPGWTTLTSRNSETRFQRSSSSRSGVGSHCCAVWKHVRAFATCYSLEHSSTFVTLCRLRFLQRSWRPFLFPLWIDFYWTRSPQTDLQRLDQVVSNLVSPARRTGSGKWHHHVEFITSWPTSACI